MMVGLLGCDLSYFGCRSAFGGAQDFRDFIHWLVKRAAVSTARKPQTGHQGETYYCANPNPSSVSCRSIFARSQIAMSPLSRAMARRGSLGCHASQ